MNTEEMRTILKQARVIAIVGHSDKPERTSYQIGQYLRRAGYTIYPVNPTVDTINGQRSYPTLEAVPEPVDIVNVFRRSEHLADIVEEAIGIDAPTVWAQLGVASEEAAARAQEAGVTLIMNTCIKVVHMQVMN